MVKLIRRNFYYRCSRWYWSTLDPMRRCRYTCTVREVRPVVPEKPVEDMPDYGDNQTIAHSPCPTAGVCVCQSTKVTEHLECDVIESHNLAQNDCLIIESQVQVADVAETNFPAEEPFVPGPPLKSDHNARPKIPSYPQTRRPAGGMSRPLPSPGDICYCNLRGV